MARLLLRTTLMSACLAFFGLMLACSDTATTTTPTTAAVTTTTATTTLTTMTTNFPTTEVTTMPATTTLTTTEATTLDPLAEYASIYTVDRETPYDHDPSGLLFKASQGYQGMLAQGHNNWYYEAGATFALLNADVANNRFGDESAYLQGAIMFSNGTEPVSRTFVVPRSGTLMVSVSVKALTDTTFHIAKNGVKIYPIAAPNMVYAPDVSQGHYGEFAITALAEDRIQFVVESGMAHVSPVIAYEDARQPSLYFDFDNEFFPNTYPRHIGDVHPYYRNGKLYMFYLETNGRYSAALLESDNMLLFREKQISRIQPYPTIDTYYVLGIAEYQDKFISYYGASATVINSSQSTDLYNWSSNNIGEIPRVNNTTGRDPAIFYDPDIDRYRIIYISYYSRDTSPGGDFDAALWLLTSEADDPYSWQASHKEMLRYDNAGASGREDPEVPQMVKIGDRWYLIASIYSRSVHGVGRLSYFKGEADTLIDDEDWLVKPEQFIDGEDICAAQLVQVGDKWYMFGWIPNDASSSYWGGALSIAREVYQLPNGDLATRLDPYLSMLLNKGLIYEMGQDITGVYGTMTSAEGSVTLAGTETRYDFANLAEARVPGNYQRIIVDYVLSIADLDAKAGIILKNEQLATRHFVIIDRATSTLSVYSRTPMGNATRSSIAMQIDDYENIEIKVIVDGSIVDVYVNGTYSLAARVTTKGVQELDNIALSLFASGSATFTDLQISKLASAETVFE